MGPDEVRIEIKADDQNVGRVFQNLQRRLQEADRQSQRFNRQLQSMNSRLSDARTSTRRQADQIRRYRQQIQTLNSRLEDQQSQLRETRRETDRLRQSTEGLGGSYTEASFRAYDYANALQIAGTSLVNIARAGGDFLSSAVQQAVALQSLRSSLVALQGSSEGATDALERLRELSRLPGLTFEGAARGFRTLRAFNVETEDAIQILRNFSNAAAVSGLDTAQFAEGIRQLGQALVRGKLEQEDYNSIIERFGPIARNLFADLGKTAEDANNRLAETGETVTEAILRVSDVSRQANADATTVTNQISNFRNAVQELQQSVGTALLPQFERLIQFATSIVDRFNSLDTSAQNTITTLGAVGVAGTGLAGIVSQIAANFAILGLGLGGTTKAIRASGFQTQQLTTQLAAVHGTIDNLTSSQQKMEQASVDTTRQQERQRRQTARASASMARNARQIGQTTEAQQALRRALRTGAITTAQYNERLRLLHGRLGGLFATMRGGGGILLSLVGFFKQWGLAIAAGAVTVGALIKAGQNLNEVLRLNREGYATATKTTIDWAQSQNLIARALRETSRDADRAAKRVQNLIAAMAAAGIEVRNVSQELRLIREGEQIFERLGQTADALTFGEARIDQLRSRLLALNRTVEDGGRLSTRELRLRGQLQIAIRDQGQANRELAQALNEVSDAQESVNEASAGYFDDIASKLVRAQDDVERAQRRFRDATTREDIQAAAQSLEFARERLAALRTVDAYQIQDVQDRNARILDIDLRRQRQSEALAAETARRITGTYADALERIETTTRESLQRQNDTYEMHVNFVQDQLKRIENQRSAERMIERFQNSLRGAGQGVREFFDDVARGVRGAGEAFNEADMQARIFAARPGLRQGLQREQTPAAQARAQEFQRARADQALADARRIQSAVAAIGVEGVVPFDSIQEAQQAQLDAIRSVQEAEGDAIQRRLQQYQFFFNAVGQLNFNSVQDFIASIVRATTTYVTQLQLRLASDAAYYAQRQALEAGASAGAASQAGLGVLAGGITGNPLLIASAIATLGIGVLRSIQSNSRRQGTTASAINSRTFHDPSADFIAEQAGRRVAAQTPQQTRANRMQNARDFTESFAEGYTDEMRQRGGGAAGGDDREYVINLNLNDKTLQQIRIRESQMVSQGRIPRGRRR